MLVSLSYELCYGSSFKASFALIQTISVSDTRKPGSTKAKVKRRKNKRCKRSVKVIFND